MLYRIPAILIVEDHILVIEGLKSAINTIFDNFLVQVVRSQIELQAAKHSGVRYDAVVLDPGLAAQHHDCPVKRKQNAVDAKGLVLDGGVIVGITGLVVPGEDRLFRQLGYKDIYHKCHLNSWDLMQTLHDSLGPIHPSPLPRPEFKKEDILEKSYFSHLTRAENEVYRLVVLEGKSVTSIDSLTRRSWETNKGQGHSSKAIKVLNFHVKGDSS